MKVEASDSRTAAPSVPPGTRVAITGATGFIGGRLVERLTEQGAAVTCLVRRAAAGTRLHGSSAGVLMLDLAEHEPLRAALEGIELVFHCAYDWDNAAWNLAALRALIAACQANGCRRLVHLSSWVVYPLPAGGEVTEESPEDASGGGYAGTKRELEAELLRAVREDGLPATILQPTIVYGPFSGWTVDPADKLRYGTVILPDAGEGICNAVYVDDVISAMILAAQHPRAVGQRFLVSGAEPITWAQFYEGMARAAGADGPQYRSAEAIERANGKLRKLLRLAADPNRIIRRIAQTGLGRTLMRAGLASLPQGLREPAEGRLFGPMTRLHGHIHLPDFHELRRLQSRATVGSAKARRELGYAPQFDFSAGMAPTARYLSDVHARLTN